MTTLAADHDLDHLRGALEQVPETRRGTAVDGGAHRGAWTRVLSESFAHVVAFEPHRGYASDIPDRENIVVRPVALGRNLGRGKLVGGEENEGQTHLMPSEDAGAWIVPLDAYRLTDVDFVKLDVEGFEEPALLGAKDTLDRCRPWVMIERNDLARTHYGFDPDGAHKRLRQLGYRRVARWNKDHLYAP